MQTSEPPQISEQSPYSVNSPQSIPYSPPMSSPSYSESDNISVASSASAMMHKFKIPDTWRPSIMECINKPTEEERKLSLVRDIPCEIVCDLVVQMYSFNPSPNKEFCTEVAKMLVKKYDFMKDIGHKVSGYVSCLNIIIMYYKLEPTINIFAEDMLL